MNSQHRTPNKRLHCIADLRARARSLGIADFCRFSSGCSILIKILSGKPISATMFVLSSSLKTGETLCIQNFFSEKKALGRDSSFSNFYVPSKNLPPFLFPDQTFMNCFPVFERRGQNHQSFVDGCG